MRDDHQTVYHRETEIVNLSRADQGEVILGSAHNVIMSVIWQSRLPELSISHIFHFQHCHASVLSTIALSFIIDSFGMPIFSFGSVFPISQYA